MGSQFIIFFSYHTIFGKSNIWKIGDFFGLGKYWIRSYSYTKMPHTHRNKRKSKTAKKTETVVDSNDAETKNRRRYIMEARGLRAIRERLALNPQLKGVVGVITERYFTLDSEANTERLVLEENVEVIKDEEGIQQIPISFNKMKINELLKQIDSNKSLINVRGFEALGEKLVLEPQHVGVVAILIEEKILNHSSEVIVKETKIVAVRNNNGEINYETIHVMI